MQFSSVVLGCIISHQRFLSDSISGWLHEQANTQSQWENKPQQKQTEWTNVQSSKLVYPDSKLCLRIEMGLSWVEMFIDVNTSLTHFLYTHLSIFIIDTYLMQDVKVVSTSSCTYCRSITAIYPVLVLCSSQPGALNRQQPEGKIVVTWSLLLNCLQHMSQGLLDKCN